MHRSNADTYVPYHEKWLCFHHQTTGLGQTRVYESLGIHDSCPPLCRKAVAWVHKGKLQFHGSTPLEPENQPRTDTLPLAVRALNPNWKWAT
jgi:hypothetical protein